MSRKIAGPRKELFSTGQIRYFEKMFPRAPAFFPRHACVGALAVWLLLFSEVLLIAGGNSSWLAQTWQTDDGLPDNKISGVVQTSDGYLWVGTECGLMRFNGAQFQDCSLLCQPGVPNRVVNSLFLDRDDHLWMAMDRGAVACVQSGQTRVFTVKDGLPDMEARLMAQDEEGAIWITYVGGRLARIKQGVVTQFDPPAGSPSDNHLCWLATDKNGRLWFARGKYAGIFSGGRFQIQLTLPKPIQRIGAARTGGIWLCTEEQLFNFKEGEASPPPIALPSNLENSVATALFEDQRGMLWIGTAASGLFCYDGSGFEKVTISHGAVACITGDHEGNLWVGTSGGGLNRLRPQALKLFNVGGGQSVRSVCEDKSGAFWLVTQDSLLLRQQGTNWFSPTNAPPGVEGDAACVAADQDGALWIGTWKHGLFQWKDNQYVQWNSSNGLASASVSSLLTGTDGDLWIATCAPTRLQRLRENQLHDFATPEMRFIRALAEDKNGTVWVGTSRGQLLRVDGDKVVDASPMATNELCSIRCLSTTDDGCLWIGYAGWGLGVLKNGHYARITTAQGLNDDYISQILPDRRGWLWFAGNRGIFCIQAAKLVDVAEQRAARVNSIVHGHGEGLPSLEATYNNYPRTLRSRDNCLCFCMRTGLLTVHTQSIRDNPLPPPVLIERVIVDSRTVAAYGGHFPPSDQVAPVANLHMGDIKISVGPTHRKIEFEFAALSFTAPENVHFRYRLDGFDENWVEAGSQRQASYGRLPAGNYRFRVIACNDSGVWNETGAAVMLQVTPFFWQTWWFRISALAGFTAVIIMVVRGVFFRRLRLRLQRLEREAAVEKERARIARDIHDDLGCRLTEVELLLDLAQRTTPDKLNDSVCRISSTVRQMGESLDEIVWAVNPRNDALPNLIGYLGQYAIQFLHTAGLRCRVDFPDQLPLNPVSPEVRHNLFLVVKEALNNVIRHAQATEVWLRASVAGGGLDLSIEDNGKGCQNAQDGLCADGLRNMRQRMAQIGGQFYLESTPGIGTRIRLVLPRLFETTIAALDTNGRGAA